MRSTGEAGVHSTGYGRLMFGTFRTIPRLFVGNVQLAYANSALPGNKNPRTQKSNPRTQNLTSP
jgi:hypothetical protein